jgi:Rrf2 family protein
MRAFAQRGIGPFSCAPRAALARGLEPAARSRYVKQACAAECPVRTLPDGEFLPVHISAKTEYACIAVLELAARYRSGEPVRIRRIAETHGIPSRFLVQILLQLKGAGLVSSTRGAAGGYQLIKDPKQIALGEVMAIIEGQPSELTSSASTQSPVSLALLDVWREVDSVERERLNSITFADLVRRARGYSENMYYI